jgi:hypothetical protein
VEQLAQEPQEEFEALPVACAFIQSLSGDDPLVAEVAAASRGEELSEPGAVLLGQVDSKLAKLGAEITAEGREVLQEDLANRRLLVIKELH